MKRSSTRSQIALIVAIASLLSARASFGQAGPDSLTLSSGTAAANGSVALNLSLNSPAGSEPSAIEWTLTYPPANVVSISVNSGPAITAAGKALNCYGSSGKFACVASAINASIISNGAVAVVNLTMAAGLATTAIGIANSAASSPAGKGILLFATGGTVTGGANLPAAPPVLPAVASLSCLPATLNSSSSSTCTVTLTQAAPTGGAAVTLTNTNPALTVPASVTVAAGATSATFIATTATIAGNQSATITAAYNSTSANATLTLVAPVLISSLACNSISLGPVSSSTCTVTLTQAAPTGGAIVTLTNTNPTLTVPASVTVAAGTASATFIAITLAFGSNQSATITATYNNSSASVTIGLVPPVTVSSLACNPNSLGPSAVSACTVTLTSVAPAGGLGLTLASNNNSLTVPASLTVAAGAASGVFSATAAAIIAGNQSVTVTASVGGSSQTATINLVAPVPPIRFVQSTSASQSSGQFGAGQTASKEFPGNVSAGDLIVVGVFVDVGATVSVTDTMGDSFTQVAHQTVSGDHDADVFVAQSGALGADTITVNAGSGKSVYAFSIHEYTGVTTAVDASSTVQGNGTAPASGSLTTITPNDLVFVWFTNGNNYLNENFSSLNPAYTKREMSGGANQCSGFSDCVESADLVAVTTLTTNATATLNVSDIWSATAIAFKGGASTLLACNPTSLGPNSASTCTVTLTQAAPAGGATVTLTNTNSTLTVPASVTVAAGATSATFSAITAAIGGNQSATITASYNGSSANAAITLVAPVLISSLTCSPTSLGPNASSTCTVALTQPAPAGGATVTVTDTNPALTVPASVTVASAATSAAFSVTTAAVSSNQSATVNATLGGSSGSVAINLVAPAVSISLSCTPTTLTGGSASTCTVTLNNPSVGSSTLSLGSNNANLTVPSGLSIANGATTGRFTASAASFIANNQTATITATLNNTSATANVSLLGYVGVSSLSCSPASIGQNASTTCTIALSNPAPAGGAAVTLSNTNATLAAPASATVSAGATTTTFAATTSAIPSDQSATLTAAYNGASAGATITLVAPVLVSSLACNPASLGPNSSSACIVTLTKNAPAGGASVLVSEVSNLLTAPPSVVIAAGSNSAAFTLLAGSFTVSQSGSVIVSYNGSSQSVAISLIAPASVSVTSLACNPNGLMSGATSLCTVTLSQPAPTATTVALSSTSSLITVPASIVIPAGNATSAFTASVGGVIADATGSVTATLGASSQTASFTLWSTPAFSSLACAPTGMPAGASSACTVTMSKSAGNIVVSLLSDNAALTVPATVTVPQGSNSAGFSATTLSSASGWIVVTAAFNGASISVLFEITAGSTSHSVQAQVNGISCTPKSLIAGSRGTCRITLDHVGNSATAEVQLSSSSASIRLPQRVATRPGQSTVDFQVDAVRSGEGIVVAANLGSGMVKDTLAVAPDRSTPIHVPGRRFVKYGTEVRFPVSPSDPAATLSTGALPTGASFDSTAGEFRWTPEGTQLGAHKIDFTAVDSAGGKASASVTVHVDSGEPVVTGVVNAASRSREAACSPGAIATIEGRWLTDGTAVADASGSSMELAGTQVWANGSTVPILSASGTELNILCPDSVPGSDIQLVVQTDHGVAQPLQTTARSAAPGIFSLDGSGTGQGWVLRKESSGTSSVAMVRNYRAPSQPAATGERLLVYVTGVGQLTNISVLIGEYKVPAEEINPVPNHPGLYQVAVSMPNIAMQKDDFPLSLSGDGPDGDVRTNVVNIAVEANLR